MNTKGTDNKLSYKDRRNIQILKKVEAWQSFKYLTPLTCPVDRAKLLPRISRDKVILTCPDCNYIQPYVPKGIIQADISIPNVLIKNQKKTTTSSIYTDEEQN